ncbi:MAG: inorganic pyrophosphatase Ppa [Desulfobacterales bacterium]
MTLPNFLQKAGKLDIEAYKKPKDWKSLLKTHVPYSGSPQKHPYDSKKVILVVDPFSTNTFFYEFKIRDVDYIEDLHSMVSIEGDAVNMVRIWIKKKSIGVRCAPFIVEDISFYSDSGSV